LANARQPPLSVSVVTFSLDSHRSPVYYSLF